MKKKAVVTGASSFLGQATVLKLRSAGYEVTGFRHGVDEAFRDLSEGRKKAILCHSRVWFHFAWAGPGSAGRQDTTIQSYNLNMSLETLKEAAMSGCERFIFAGSQAEYGHAQDGTLKKEEGEKAPISEYGRTKLKFGQEAPQRLKAMGCDMQYIHMRIFSAYGPGDHKGSLLNSLIRSLLKDEDVSLSHCLQLWDYIYIDDFKDAMYLLSEKATSGCYNIGSGDTRPLKSYVMEASRLVLKDEALRHLHFGMRGDNAEGDADLSPDISRLRRLGFKKKVSFDEGIKKLKESQFV